MSLYNLTNYTQPDGMQGILQTTNNLMEGYFGVLLLIGLFVIIFSAMQWGTGDIKRSFTGSSFICFIVSIMLTALEILSPIAVFVMILALAGSVVALVMENRY